MKSPELYKISDSKDGHASGKDNIETKKSSELIDIFSHFDFNVIKQSIQELMKKSGLNPDNINFISPDKINESSEVGSYSTVKNTLTIGFERAKEIALFVRADLELLILDTLIHEELHAASYRFCYGPTEEKIQKVTTGFYEVSLEDNMLSRKFTSFNEGVTQLLSRQIGE